MEDIAKSRKLPFEEEENEARKRRRLMTSEGDYSASMTTPSASFNSLNDDCLVHILSFLSYEGMNTVAVCSRACREARSNEYLNQTRTGTIICSERATGRSIYEILVRWKESNILGGHPIHLRIENASNIGPDPVGRSVTSDEALGARFGRIVSINLSIDPENAAADQPVDGSSLECIFQICDETRAIDMSGLKIGDSGRLFTMIGMHGRRLRRLVWNNSESNEILFGSYPCQFDNATLFMDDCCFQSSFSVADTTRQIFEQQPSFVGVIDMDFYLMKDSIGLTGLSIKNATWYADDNPEETFPVSQGMLIKMVRNHRTLQWLQSDLSAENVARLQQERPDITFVSD